MAKRTGGSKMPVLRIVVIVLFVLLAIYTAVVMANHGTGFGPVFMGDLYAMNWSGQFNLDFFTYVLLSSLWIAWRHAFSPLGIVLALIGLIGGMLYFAIYLLVAMSRANGDMHALLLGAQKERP